MSTSAPPAATMRDPRMRRLTWEPLPRFASTRVRMRVLILFALPLLVWYLTWLLQPERVGHPLLYGMLVTAELFNVVQALGLWWTCSSERLKRVEPRKAPAEAIDVFIPVYNEPVEIVELTVAGAARIAGRDVRVWLLDDGDSDAMAALAARYGVGYLRRPEHSGAKAGNVNHALGLTDAPFVAIFDADHVADPHFYERTRPLMDDPLVAFVQTPQFYANADAGPVASASWAQQSLFFGCIARGKAGLGAIFCCGTNVLFRREALDAIGGIPTDSVTEDFELSLHLHERGWRSEYVPDVLSRGLGPEDMASYVSQQLRWARGCLSALPRVLRSRLPLKLRLQYLLSSSYWLTGWTVLIYMSFPVISILTGAQPLSGITAGTFLAHFAPYFAMALLAVALAGGGTYTFSALALSAASFWIQVYASILVLLRRKGSFVVTPKQGAAVRQPRAIAPTLTVIAILLSVCLYGLLTNPSTATLNNVAFALFHVTVLGVGASPALRKPAAA